MILVTDISGSRLYVNNDLIERLECVPDTIVVLTTGHRILVRETAGHLARLIENHQRRIHGRYVRGAYRGNRVRRTVLRRTEG